MHTVIKQDGLKPAGIYSIPRGKTEVQVETLEGSLDGMPVYFINGDPIRASGSVYSSNNKLDAEEYVFFALAALELPRQINWNPNVMHCNDWQSALIPLYLKTLYAEDEFFQGTRTLLSIHNLGYQGVFPPAAVRKAGLPDRLFYPLSPVEFYNSFSFLKSGISYSDVINTVQLPSPPKHVI